MLHSWSDWARQKEAEKKKKANKKNPSPFPGPEKKNLFAHRSLIKASRYNILSFLQFYCSKDEL